MNPSTILYASLITSRQFAIPFSPLMFIANELSSSIPLHPSSSSTTVALALSPSSLTSLPSSFSCARYYTVPRRSVSTFRLYSQVTELGSRISGRVPKGVRTVTKDLLLIRNRLDNWSIVDIRTFILFLYAVKYRISPNKTIPISGISSNVPNSSSECKESTSSPSVPSKSSSLNSSLLSTSTSTLTVDKNSRTFLSDSVSSLFSTPVTIPQNTVPQTDIHELKLLRILLMWSHASYSIDINEVNKTLRLRNDETVDPPPPSSSSSSSSPSSPPAIEILHTALHADADALLPAFIVGVDHSIQSVIISIRGSWSWQDAMINFSVLPETLTTPSIIEQYKREHPHAVVTDEELSNLFTAHRGMVLTAKNLIHTLESSLGLLSFLHLQNYPSYSIRIVGHSLGGGIASMMAILLQSHIRGIRAYSFSSPACMSAPLAKACQNVVTSIVNGDDVVSRFHVSSSEILREELQNINWTKEVTERTGIDRLLARLPSVSLLPSNIEDRLSSVTNTLSQASSSAVGTIQKLIQSTTTTTNRTASTADTGTGKVIDSSESQSIDTESIGRKYNLSNRLQRHKHQTIDRSSSSSSSSSDRSASSESVIRPRHDTAQVLSQAESVSPAYSSTASTLLAGVKNTLLQSINVIKPVLRINDNVSIPIEINATSNSSIPASSSAVQTTTATTTIVNPTASPAAPVAAETMNSSTTISLNKAMQYYIPGDIYWMYYPTDYTRIMETRTTKSPSSSAMHRSDSSTKPGSTNNNKTLARHQRTIKRIHDMEDFHVDLDDVPPNENDEAVKSEFDNDIDDADDDAYDDIDNDILNPLVSRIALDDMGTRHHEVLSSSHENTKNPPYVGGILLKVPYATKVSSLNATDSGTLLKELPHALFATITMSKWIFMDHTATSLEYEWDHYLRWLQQQEQKNSSTTAGNTVDEATKI